MCKQSTHNVRHIHLSSCNFLQLVKLLATVAICVAAMPTVIGMDWFKNPFHRSQKEGQGQMGNFWKITLTFIITQITTNSAVEHSFNCMLCGLVHVSRQGW